ncbi:Monoacylglycerol lipase ABHD12 [Sphaceloma murrayae]|uniref:Monoacylglycerol lipase ABHD12 n=1 Tax=Sphaceloma murrayae TaxID=2082308 RepID=A0A2K1R3T3_9PEZI|nr:Monoacylglycerol lipase ABHD12 [Sphaceloma murrayae]
MALSVGARWAIATPALLVLLYIIFIGLLLIPWLQRHAIYVHKINSEFWHNTSDPTTFGFACNQVRTFSIPTPDGILLQAWHVIPLDVYAAKREELAATTGKDSNLLLSLLTSDPSAKVLISFHGNAGHIAQGWRTDTYRSFSALPNTHTITIDYRGFGRSTGSPTEAGLITDGIALVNYVMHTLGIPPERIAIVGQSLGTAVAAAVTLYFADPKNALIPSTVAASATPSTPLLKSQDVSHPSYDSLSNGAIAEHSSVAIDPLAYQSALTPASSSAPSGILFAGTTLIAPFINIPRLLLTYKAGGVIPLLGPLRPFRFLHGILDWGIQDQWQTLLRLQAFYSAAQKLRSDDVLGAIHVVHAFNDADINWRQSRGLWEGVTGRTADAQLEKKQATSLEERVDGTRFTVELVEHGGHNRVCTYSEVHLAVRRMLTGSG